MPRHRGADQMLRYDRRRPGSGRGPGVEKDLQHHAHCRRRLQARHRGSRCPQGDVGLVAFGRCFISNPEPAVADRSRSLPLTARPEYLLRVQCARPHRLCDVRRGEVASRGLSAWSGRTRRCPRLRSASEFPENVVGAGDREGAVADGERHTLGRVAPDVAGGEDARAGGLYHAGLALCERPRLRPRGAGAGCRSIRFAR